MPVCISPAANRKVKLLMPHRGQRESNSKYDTTLDFFIAMQSVGMSWKVTLQHMSLFLAKDLYYREARREPTTRRRGQEFKKSRKKK